MRRHYLLSLAVVLPLLAACQNNDGNPDTMLQGRQTMASTGTTSGVNGQITRPQLIAMADGRHLSIPCLNQKAPSMEQASSDSERMMIAGTCDVRALHATSSSRGTYGDYAIYYVPGYSYAAYYDPRAYCYNNNYNGYYWYSLFNQNYNFNWMSALGYTGYNYYSYSQYPQYYSYNYYPAANGCIYYGGYGCNNQYYYYTYLY